jgi:hypothetical protein
VEVSTDRGHSYRQVLAQDYTFSPQGATFQQEDLRLDLSGITHLRLTVVPNKGGTGIATLTSLRKNARWLRWVPRLAGVQRAPKGKDLRKRELLKTSARRQHAVE